MAAHVLVVQHQDSCPPALIGEWLVAAGLVLDVRRPDLGEALPDDLTSHDALLVLGGAMDAVDEAGHPWLAATVALLARAVAEGVPTWGVCLGHQLLARACGGVVDRNPRGRQVGVLTMGWTPDAADDALVGPLATSAVASRCLQWNQDIVVEVPPTAVVLARTAADEPQVVRFASRAWGVQAHPEAGPELVSQWADEADSDVASDRARQVLGELAAAAPELSSTWRPVADAFAALVVQSAHTAQTVRTRAERGLALR